ncbi:MAG: group II intron maturase-specific domain-containing protein, partial [Solirubrobacteraceae bacterium]
MTGKVKQITRTGPNQTLDQLLHRLNPVLRGWCAYFHHGVSSRTFNYLRAYTWRRVIIWLRHKHHGRNWRWLRRATCPAGGRPLRRSASTTPAGSRSSATATAVPRSRPPGSNPSTNSWRLTSNTWKRRSPDEPPACSWRTGCVGTRTSGSVGGQGKRSGSKDRHRASGLPNHVVQLANQPLDEVRRDYWNELRATGQADAAKAFKDARWALLKAPTKLTDQQAATLARLKAAGGEVWRAYTLKEAVRAIFQPGLSLEDVTILID